MNVDQKRLEQEVCRDVARVIKESTGRGPVATEAFLNESNVLIIVSGFMIPIEIKLADSVDGCSEVKSSRVSWAMANKDQRIEKMTKVLNRKVVDFFFDFNPKTNTAIIVYLFE